MICRGGERTAAVRVTRVCGGGWSVGGLSAIGELVARQNFIFRAL